jgi:hypothetical protein
MEGERKEKTKRKVDQRQITTPPPILVAPRGRGFDDTTQQKGILCNTKALHASSKVH